MNRKIAERSHRFLQVLLPGIDQQHPGRFIDNGDFPGSFQLSHLFRGKVSLGRPDNIARHGYRVAPPR
jgi:hypothetical protein